MNRIFKNDIFLKTIIYIIGIIIFFYYWYILGSCNAFVGVTIVKGTIMLLNKDLTANPIRNLVIVTIVFICIGFFSYLAALNIYFGLFINFFTIFIITYNFVSNLNQSIWMPFVLGYLYLLVKPIQYDELFIRIIALGVGSLFVIFSQLLLNKRKYKNTIKNNLLKVLELTSNNIKELISKKENGKKKNFKKFQTIKCIEDITKVIYNRRLSCFYIEEKDNIILNLSLCIERLNYEINKINISSQYEIYLSFFRNLNEIINYIKEFVKDDIKIEFLIERISEFTSSYNEEVENNYFLYEIIQALKLLETSLNNFLKLKRNNLKNLIAKEKLNIINSIKLNFNRNSLKFTYAFKLALLLSLSYFFVELFKIPQGKWITFTIFATVQPYMESSKKRFNGRFKGTIIGILIFVIIDIFIPYLMIKIIIFIILYYIFMISNNFALKSICTTVVGIGVFSTIKNDPIGGIFYRFMFMSLGILIGYLGTKYIFPYSIKDSLKRLVSQYYNLNNYIFEIGLKNKVDYKIFDEIDKKILLSRFFESKILINNSTIKLDDINSFIYNQRILNSNLYFLCFSICNQAIDFKIFSKIKNNIDSIYKDDLNNISNQCLSLKNITENDFSYSKNNNEKLLLITIYKILLRLKISKNLVLKINNDLNSI